MQKAVAQVFVISVLTFSSMWPSATAAETFTSKEFLTWPNNSQRGYFQASIGMAGLIVGENNKTQARCIERWYFENQDAAEAAIRETMERFPNYHPRGVIAAFLEKQCGSFIFR